MTIKEFYNAAIAHNAEDCELFVNVLILSEETPGIIQTKINNDSIRYMHNTAYIRISTKDIILKKRKE